MELTFPKAFHQRIKGGKIVDTLTFQYDDGTQTTADHMDTLAEVLEPLMEQGKPFTIQWYPGPAKS